MVYVSATYNSVDQIYHCKILFLVSNDIFVDFKTACILDNVVLAIPILF